MYKKPKFLVLTVAPLLLLFLSGCLTDSETFVKYCDFRKTVEKKVATVGESLEVTLSIKNRSTYNVEYYELDKEINQEDFLVVGSNIHIGRNLGEWKTHEIVYRIIPLRSGKLKIGPSKIFRVKLENEEKAFMLPKNVGFSTNATSTPLVVKPSKLEIRAYLKKTRLKLGMMVELHAVIWNHGLTTVRGVNVAFEKYISELRHEFRREFIEIPPGGHRKARFLFKAVKAGKVTPGRAVVFFGRQEITDDRFSSSRIFGISQNPLPQIQIDEVSLPGMDFSLRCYTKEISSYFSLLFLKIMGVVVALLAIVILFAKAVYSRIVDSLGGRVLLWTLTVGVGEIILIFLGYGIIWIWRTTPPDLWTIGMIYTISSGMALFSGTYPLRSPILGSLIAGGALSLAGYLVFVGFSAMEINGFNGFPVKEASLLFIAASIVTNSREFKRR